MTMEFKNKLTLKLLYKREREKKKREEREEKKEKREIQQQEEEKHISKSSVSPKFENNEIKRTSPRSSIDNSQSVLIVILINLVEHRLIVFSSHLIHV